jgi:cellulase/cellobiase CelA1
VRFTSTTTADWGSGFCADVSVTNTGTRTVSPWTVDLPLTGTVTSVWNASLTPRGDGTAAAAGAAYNATLLAGGATSFGYCATRPAPTPVPTPPGQATATTTVTADWGSGYCASVAVRNPATTPVLWNADVPVGGSVTALWNAKGAVTGGVLKATGETWNATLAGGASTDFGFCASR